MPIAAGTQLGRYEIRSPLGAGGMGEVYLAWDSQLNRAIALKILPADVASNPERMHRFIQEARAAAALSHPNIAHIYEVGETDGTHFIAMEFIDGVTLREKIYGDKADLKKLLNYLTQVAEGLAKAHAAGIVHRDLKPDNIMITRDGFAKILDFGLAKLVEPHQPLSVSDDGLSEAMTAMLPQHSQPGMVMGTIGYMSPEQAQGRTAGIDHRSDIFSFGCILYEAATERKPFEGVSVIDTLHKIIYAQAPLIRDLNPLGPAGLQRIVRRCLAKDPEERYQTIKDVVLELKDLLQEIESGSEQHYSVAPAQGSGSLTGRSRQGVTEGTSEPGARTQEVGAGRSTSSAEYIVSEIKRHKTGAVLGLAALVTAAAVSFGLYKFIGQKPSLSVESKAAPKIIPFTSFPGHEDQPAFSPDGNQIAFVWDGEREDNNDIYVKLSGTGTPLRLTTNPASETSPTWSPDGRSIAFLRQSAESAGIYLIPALGGPERKLADVFPGKLIDARSLHYSPDGKFLAISDKSSAEEPFSISLLSIESGTKRRLTSPSARSGGDLSPAFSPEGNTLAFTRFDRGGTSDLYLIPVAGGEPKRLTFDNENQYDPAWTSDGREIVFCSGPSFSLWRIPISGGTPERLVEGAHDAYPAISRQGNRLAYSRSTGDTDIWRIDLQGSSREGPSPSKLISSTLVDAAPQYSPDGRKIVFESNRSGSPEIWICDSNGSNPVQLTSLGGPDTGSPRWSPDGLRVAFDCAAAGQWDIYVASVEGGLPRRLTTAESSEYRPSWSRDGRWVYFSSNRSGETQIWKMPAEGGEAVQVTKHGSGIEAFESSDGREVYYHKANSSSGNIRMGSIWRITVEGEREEQVLDRVPEGYWAVADQGIYFLNPEVTPLAIELYSFDTGGIRKIAVVEKEPPWATSGLTASLDGRSILYTQLDRKGNDIMVVENFR